MSADRSVASRRNDEVAERAPSSYLDRFLQRFGSRALTGVFRFLSSDITPWRYRLVSLEMQRLFDLLADLHGMIVEQGARLQSDRMVGKRELAEYLSISERTIDRLVEDKELPTGVRLGKQLRWRISQVDGFLAARTAKQTGGTERRFWR